MKPLPSLILALLGLPFLACGAFLGMSLGGALLQRREFARQVPATIIGYEQIAVGGRRPIHRPTVRYTYVVDGVPRESIRHDLLQTFPVVSLYLGRRGRLPYGLGQTVTAHVDAEGEAVLSLELQYAALLGPSLLIFLLIGGALTAGAPWAAWRTAAAARDRERGILAPRFESSQFALGVLTGVVAAIALMTGLGVHEARAWSVPAGIIVAAFAAGAAALARLLLRERARRRPFSASRLRVSGTEWTLSRGRLSAPSLELALREETRSMGDDGPGPWKGTDLVSTPLASTPTPEGWRGTLEKDGAQPPAIDEPHRRRTWLVRVRDGSREAIFPL